MKCTIIVIFWLWLCSNIIYFLLGISDANESQFFGSNCKRGLAKIEYIVPGYRVGCYLGKFHD